jgi:DNA invertase Pin-like site-specific DNA recombinase
MTGRVVSWGDKLSAVLRAFSEHEEVSIRDRLAGGERVTELAREFGVHRTTISKIKKGTYRDKYRR